MAYKVRFTVSADVPACAAMEPIAECLGIRDKTVYTFWHWMVKKLPGNNRNKNSRAGKRECLAYIAQRPEVIYPLRIHFRFYGCPNLARRYALPLEGVALAAAVRNRYSDTEVPEGAF